MKPGPKSKPYEDKFWSKVAPMTEGRGCWEWTDKPASHGYGQIICPGRTRTAHRTSWEIHFGSIPQGMCVLHSCDNRTCVKPEHLFLGTKKDNTDDMIAKGRNRVGSGGHRRWHVNEGKPCTCLT